jgi:hypothetical protein
MAPCSGWLRDFVDLKGRKRGRGFRSTMPSQQARVRPSPRRFVVVPRFHARILFRFSGVISRHPQMGTTHRLSITGYFLTDQDYDEKNKTALFAMEKTSGPPRPASAET